ncbi:MAG TPA: ATP-binding protein [Anaeromyxobacter sp.]|nr:ATP-binding protein [Anaeromyxobacter sp.]
MGRATSRSEKPKGRRGATPRPRPRARPAPRTAPAALGAADIVEAFARGPLAAALVQRGRVAEANEAFARALGTGLPALRGRALAELLPPAEGEVPEPGPGASLSYRTVVDGIPARVDLASARRPRPDGSLLVTAVLTPLLAQPDDAAERALLALSRELADARSEDHITRTLARALEVLFPGRSFAIRLVDPRTLALRTFYARGRLRGGARARLALRRAAVEKTGLSRSQLEEAGVSITEVDEPVFEGSEAAMVVPLAVGGALFGVLNVEYVHGGPGDRESDAPLLYRLANHAALGVRNVRSFEELTTLKNYLEDLVEHANALIFVVNRCREVIVWNAGLVKLTAFAREDAVGDDLFAFVPEDERKPLEEVLLRGFSGEAVAGYETRLLRAGGGEARIAVNTAPILDAAGEIDGVVAIGQDLTLVRSLQAAAEHAERLAGIGRLVAGVVHELNNPLTAVNMYSDVLVEKLQAAGHDPADVEKLRAIKESGLRIQRLARDLVSYARPAGAHTEPVELAPVLDEAARLAKPALKDRSAVLERVFEDVPPVEASRPALVQVFVNLVTNAAQASPPGGRVTLRLGRDAGEVKVVVEDEGAGMEPEVERRAFEPFFTTRPGVGIGLGLPIVQGIVERHGGRVALATAPGEGTRVTVTLPMQRAR